MSSPIALIHAGGALAAYAARANVGAHVYMPRDAPRANQAEVAAYGAKLTLVDGLINDAARLATEAGARKRWFDVSTFKVAVPFRGKEDNGV